MLTFITASPDVSDTAAIATESPAVAQLRTFIAVLLASQTMLTPQVMRGITSGPGNQGTAALIHRGQSGTAATQLGVPRMQHFGVGGTAQGSNAP